MVERERKLEDEIACLKREMERERERSEMIQEDLKR